MLDILDFLCLRDSKEAMNIAVQKNLAYKETRKQYKSPKMIKFTSRGRLKLRAKVEDMLHKRPEPQPTNIHWIDLRRNERCAAQDATGCGPPRGA